LGNVEIYDNVISEKERNQEEKQIDDNTNNLEEKNYKQGKCLLAKFNGNYVHKVKEKKSKSRRKYSSLSKWTNGIMHFKTLEKEQINKTISSFGLVLDLEVSIVSNIFYDGTTFSEGLFP